MHMQRNAVRCIDSTYVSWERPIDDHAIVIGDIRHLRYREVVGI